MKEQVPPLAAQACGPDAVDVPAVLVTEAVTVVAVWPVLLSVHANVAAVGDVVGELLLQPLRDNAGGVFAAFTTRFTAVDAADPVFGVAVSVPL